MDSTANATDAEVVIAQADKVQVTFPPAFTRSGRQHDDWTAFVQFLDGWVTVEYRRHGVAEWAEGRKPHSLLTQDSPSWKG